MSQQLWPIEIDCDAPPYTVVQASRQAGFRTPEDVRWLRLKRHALDRPAPDGTRPHCLTCRCGVALPKISTVAFAFASGAALTLRMVQCARCRTVYWDEAELTP